MWKRFSSSLTLRIFLITSALLIAACALTYGAIAYLTPISYTSLLEEELRQEVAALISRLEAGSAQDSQDILQDFARRTGADMRLTDVNGTVLYDTLPTVSAAGSIATQAGEVQVVEGTLQADSAEPSASAASSSSAGSGDAERAMTQTASGDSTVMQESIVIEERADSGTATAVEEGIYSLVFQDGERGELIVQGGRRAVNQAAEAMKQVLPFLGITILAFSFVGSFFYARFITRPIMSLSGIARRIAALDFAARWTGGRTDEIGVLGDSLNALSGNLSGALRDLETANAALQRDIDRERELDRQRLAFFSAASHELKTPITILKGQLSGMLAQIGIYQDREKYLARALEVTGRMEGLVKEILTLNRIGSVAFSLTKKPVNLSALMERQLALDEELMERKELSLTKRIDPDVRMEGDEALLSKALDNVLMNAILYSPTGASMEVVVGDHGFSVENTGVSIPEDSFSELFTPFYRVEQSRNRKSGGSGLGLYLVKSILDLHGASCRMENTEKGVRFTASVHGEYQEVIP